jgi:4'-phosphopantetheinyl transferase
MSESKSVAVAWDSAAGEFGAVALSAHVADVWEIPLDSPAGWPAAAGLLLDEAEQQRARNFHFDHDRRRWVAARSALRAILSRYVAIPPTRLRFVTNAFGKPRLQADGGSSPIHFNLAHSAELALLAVAHNPIGIDVEHTNRHIGWETLAQEVFSINELADRLTGSGPQSCLTLFDLWTRKEAYIKARGLGLSIPLHSFEIYTHPADGTCRVRIAPEWDDGRDWRLHRLTTPAHYSAALACASLIDGIRRFSWPNSERDRRVADAEGTEG